MLVGSSTSKKRSFSEEDYQVSRMCKTMINVKLNQRPKASSWSQIFGKKPEASSEKQNSDSGMSCNFCNCKADELVSCNSCEGRFCSKCSTTMYDAQFCYSKCLDC